MAEKWTLFEYLYRDAGNYKAFGSLALEGALSEQELAEVHSRFGDGYFIAEQLGAPALYQQLYAFSGGPTRDDHCWHEFLGMKVIGESDLPLGAEKGGPAEDFWARVLAVREWREELSPLFRSTHDMPCSRRLAMRFRFAPNEL